MRTLICGLLINLEYALMMSCWTSFSVRHFARMGASRKGRELILPSLSTAAWVFNSDCPKNRTSTTSPGPNKYFLIPCVSIVGDEDEEGALGGACVCCSCALSGKATSTRATTGDNRFKTFMTPLTASSLFD